MVCEANALSHNQLNTASFSSGLIVRNGFVVKCIEASCSSFVPDVVVVVVVVVLVSCFTGFETWKEKKKKREREITPRVNRSVSCHSASRPAKRGTPRHCPSELCIRGRCLHRRFSYFSCIKREHIHIFRASKENIRFESIASSFR